MQHALFLRLPIDRFFLAIVFCYCDVFFGVLVVFFFVSFLYLSRLGRSMCFVVCDYALVLHICHCS